MRHDRLRKNSDDIHNLDELIEAREERSSIMGSDRDSLEQDVDIPEDLDIDDALTFPHPKHRHTEDVDLMSTPHEENMDEDWADQDILPTDYEHEYDEATDAHATDDLDEVAGEQMHDMSHMSADEMTDEESLEVMPDKFTPDKETKEL